ncbi:hypothetical protein BOTBODRAFT_33762 [Botryobasidium botryosum FD-172 SS1]|uniref:Endonuclease n=1 Tax=Botryobasidium botryosum (strain FD-172 SS1) TaxID=930990 RepID=A0A067MBK6_BOTB1|nr:hypothetical protein BOTBODRAFT_33762 [Botryobasidium botryosum FD-172 SS1]
MSTSTALRLAFFGAGAAIGAGAAAILSRQKPSPSTVHTLPAPAAPQGERLPDAILRTGPTGGLVVQDGLPVSKDVLRYGSPGPIADIITRKAYVAGYDRRLRHPSWTAEHLTASSITRSPGGGGDRGNSTFKEDELIPVPFRARLADYFRSGYDRGHMVPAADAKSSQEAMDETFFLTNIAPQVGAGFNRHYWAYLEEWCRRLTGTFADVYVFTVPLYLPRQNAEGKWHVNYEVIGNPPNVAVPTHFAKVVLGSKQPGGADVSLGAFVLPNAIIPDEAPLESFAVPVETVERAAGLTLFPESIKASAKQICKTTRCDVMVRRFDDAQQQARGPKALPAPRQ